MVVQLEKVCTILYNCMWLDKFVKLYDYNSVHTLIGCFLVMTGHK